MNVAGQVVSSVVAGHAVIAGHRQLPADRSMGVPAPLQAARRAAEVEGRTAVLAGWDGAARVALVVADTVKPSSRRRWPTCGARD